MEQEVLGPSPASFLILFPLLCCASFHFPKTRQWLHCRFAQRLPVASRWDWDCSRYGFLTEMTSLMVSSTTDGRDELAEGISATPLAGTAFSSSAMASACCDIWRISENWGRARLTGRKRPSESALSLSHCPRSLSRL
ncbi:hypothetical protein LI328DRAFT_71505 [Trichoderma asperelloides]|nr:hypothetical protein LI328DRAFT_71505 [Trichoderma asperelloides]